MSLSRRDFLWATASSAAGLAGLWAAPGAAAAAPSGMHVAGLTASLRASDETVRGSSASVPQSQSAPLEETFSPDPGSRAWARGSRDIQRVLLEAVEGKFAVALLADLESRTLFAPTDEVQAFRTTHGIYSAIKPLSYWAGLQQGLIQPDTGFTCTGEHCPFGGHGRIIASEAVWRSCNAFFLQLGPKLDRDRWLEMLRGAGFGQVSGLGGELEVPGILPSRIANDDEAALLAAHGTGIRATPLQMLLYAVRFAVSGRSFPLNGRLIEAWPPEETTRIDLVRRTWRLHALKGVGQRADRRSFPLGSRTGSARGSGWYLGFGPFESPRYVVAVHVGAPPSSPGYPMPEAVRIGGSIFRNLT